MRTLLILRHAKSSWDHPGLSDHDRPLNKRGFRDAPRMGRLLSEQDLIPEAIFTSTALRARNTAELAAEAAGFPGDVEPVAALYGAAPSRYLEVVEGLAEDRDPVMVVGHNPGIEMLVRQLTDRQERMPTAALARVVFDLDEWRSLGGAVARLADLWRPKELPSA